MNKLKLSGSSIKYMHLIVALMLPLLMVMTASAQTPDTPPKAVQEPAQEPAASSPPAQGEVMFEEFYRKFYATYRLGPSDELAVRVKGQPEYSSEKIKVSPTGTIYHVLLGEVEVVGLTISQLTDLLTRDLSEYLKNPQVSVQLIEAQSVKIGVLGDVLKPGVYVMSRPMRLLDIISEAGGFTEMGNKSAVEVNRLMADGSRKPLKVNIKNILEGKTTSEDNPQLQGGDVVIVHGNFKKKLAVVSSLVGFGQFLSFITLGGR